MKNKEKKIGYVELHRHDEFSLFDGFGSAKDLAKIAKNIGYDALALTNHGDMGGLMYHYEECKNNEIKPIFGNEVYFQPNVKKTRTSFHLCLLVKNFEGWKNLNHIFTEANKEENFYYKPLVDFDMLERYHEGLVCTSACIGGLLSKMLMNDKEHLAYKYAKKFKEIFGEDYYIEIQPYEVSEERLQEDCNIKLMNLADELDIPCILTSDSHFGSIDDFDTYLKMREIGGQLELGKSYSERYLPTEEEIINRFVEMHEEDFDHPREALKFAHNCVRNIRKIVDEVEDDIFDNLELKLPVFSEEDSHKQIIAEVKKGLKEKGKYNKKYINRCKEELEIIHYHGFEDYFLIVQDYIKWAKNQGIGVGPGRGSVCNSLVAYALGITDVDSIIFELDFRRFLRKDKKSFPDIDMDFETARRGEVIEYLLKRYEGKAAQICSYGTYKFDNCLNDLFKVCGLNKYNKDLGTGEVNKIENTCKDIKSTLKQYLDSNEDFDFEAAMLDEHVKEINENYDNIIIHFNKLYRKIRNYGTHAAGVAISGEDIRDHTALIRRKGGLYTTAYDLKDLEGLRVLKFDMLGLRTMSIVKEMRDYAHAPDYFNYDWLNDEKIFKAFGEGKTDGIFQYESGGAKKILEKIHCDCFNDVAAASALNRPGPLQQGMVDVYANNKIEYMNTGKMDESSSMFFDYTKESYGTFLYQEQIMDMCVRMSGMTWQDADKLVKFMKGSGKDTKKSYEMRIKEQGRMKELFVNGAIKNNVDRKIAEEAFSKLDSYTFNKGHAIGYGLISVEQMYYKIYHNLFFWYVTLKYGKEEALGQLSSMCVNDGIVILLSHVNGSAKYSIEEIDGEKCIREGLTNIKNVGEIAATIIEREKIKNGKYKNEEDFLNRMEEYKSKVNIRVIEKLKKSGALEFNEDLFYKRCANYNSSLITRGNKKKKRK